MIVVVVGPTGVGKTKLSVALAHKLNAVIINGDSMQVYKDLNIGTAKIKEEEKEGIEHFLFDIKNPQENYTIYDYQKDGRNLLNKFIQENKNIIIVGGSGLYIKSLLYDYRFSNEDIKNDFEELTNEEILEEIKKHYDTNIHVNNRKRLVRELNKIKNNSNIKSDIYKPLYKFITIGLTCDRDKLYEIVNNRVDKMFKEGLLAEVKKLYDNNIYGKAINTGIGYKELYDYFNHKISLDEAKELIKKNTRHFIKRQYTFFQKQMEVNWLNVDFDNFQNTIDEANKLIENN